MGARIVLVRHGPSAHVHTLGAIDHSGVKKWLDSYDTAGIQAASEPPAALVKIAADAAHIIASDLRRAIESAERLAPRRLVRVSELLRETPLSIPRLPNRLPLGAWDTLMHLNWFYRIVRGTDTAEPDRARAAIAAEWLAGIVGDSSTALVVTHGVFRRQLAQQLMLCGWANSGRQGGYRNWSAWHFARPAGTDSA
jgi:broad specificity phosphatase PhoE